MAAWGNFVLDKGFLAAAALTKFRAVKATSNADEVTPVTAASDVVLGIAQYSVSAGEIAKQKQAAVRLMGVSEMECAGNITRGGLVTINASGQAKAAATGERVVGVALGTGAASTRIPVALTIPGPLAP